VTLRVDLHGNTTAGGSEVGERVEYGPVCTVVAQRNKRVPTRPFWKIRIGSAHIVRVYVVTNGSVVRIIHEHGRRSDHIFIVTFIIT